MFKKSIALAVPALAATALVAASLSGGAVQASSNGDDKTPPPKAAKAAKAVTLAACNGGIQKRSWDRGVVGDSVYAYDSENAVVMPGSVIHVPGPNKGFDWISVNFSAGTYLANGAYGQVKVLKNGLALRPSDNVYGSFHYQTSYGSISRNYCTKIGKAGANLRVVVDALDSDGTPDDYFQVFDPMVHVELAD